MISQQEDMKEAVKRIGLTPDGEMLCLWLQGILQEVVPTDEPGALQRNNGERIFARRLINLLCAGIDEAHASARSGRIIVLKQPTPAERQPDDFVARWRAKRFPPEPGGPLGPGPEPAPGSTGSTGAA